MYSTACAARIQGRKAIRRIRALHPDLEVRLVPSRKARDSEHDRAHLRMGRATGGCCPKNAVFDVRCEAMLSASRACYCTALIY
jgi:hypothetical protein